MLTWCYTCKLGTPYVRGVALSHEELARTTTDYNSSLVAGLRNCVQGGATVEEYHRSSRVKHRTGMPHSRVRFQGAEGCSTATRCSMKRTSGTTFWLYGTPDGKHPETEVPQSLFDKSHWSTLEPFEQARSRLLIPTICQVRPPLHPSSFIPHFGNAIRLFIRPLLHIAKLHGVHRLHIHLAVWQHCPRNFTRFLVACAPHLSVALSHREPQTIGRRSVPLPFGAQPKHLSLGSRPSLDCPQ